MAIFYNKTKDFLVEEVRKGNKKPGLLHTPYYEEMPTFEKAGCEFAYPDLNYPQSAGDASGGAKKLNCQIVFGRDRPSHLLSGYGKIGGTPCASIDIVAGRLSSAVNKVGKFVKHIEPVSRETLVGNNFALDASRIYISQKCDIDHYFGLPPGEFGRPKGEAGIGIKSDHVRLIGRESVKIFAGAGQFENVGNRGELNSNGERLVNPKIDLIAGDPEDMQALVRGHNLVELLTEIMDQLSKLEQAFLLQNTSIAKLKTVLATHFHTGGGAGVVVVGPDPVLAATALSEIPRDLQKIANNITKSLNFEIIKMNYLGIGFNDNPKLNLKTKKNILSRNVYAT